jgi:uncharacterized protein (TIGR00251 family)
MSSRIHACRRWRSGGDGTWLARVKAAPVDGKANDELIALIAQRFGLRKVQVSIRSGAAGRAKCVRIDD